jgi:hypothetical protein
MTPFPSLRAIAPLLHKCTNHSVHYIAIGGPVVGVGASQMHQVKAFTLTMGFKEGTVRLT